MWIKPMDYYHVRQKNSQPKGFYLVICTPAYPDSLSYANPEVAVVDTVYKGMRVLTTRLSRAHIDAVKANDDCRLVYCVEGDHCECVGVFK